MYIIPFRIHNAAYGVYKFGVGTPYWNYVNVWGQVYDCNDLLLAAHDQLYAQVQLEGEHYKIGEEYGGMMSPLDLRTLEMVKGGCCPPGLINVFLEGKEL